MAKKKQEISEQKMANICGPEVQRYKNIFELSPETILIVDRSGKLLDINERVFDIMGYKREDLINMSILRLPFLTRSAVTKIGRKFALRMLGREVETYEVELKTKKGEIRTATISATPMRNANNKITGEIVIANDVTEIKEAQAALKKSEERFKGLAEQNFDVIFILDPAGKVEYASPSLKDMLGYDAKDASGMSFTQFFPRSELAAAKESFGGLQKGEKHRNIKYKLKRKDGKEIFVEVNASPFLNKDGKPTAIFGSIHDITAQTEAQNELKKILLKSQEDEEKFRNIFNNSGDAIFIYDLTGKFLEVNDIAVKRLGYMKKQLLTMSLDDIYPEQQKKEVKKRINEVKLRKRGLFIGTHVSKVGKKISVELNNNLISFKGQPVILSVSRDITKRLEAEKGLKREQQRAQKYLDLAGAIIMALDKKGIVTMINNKGAELLGYSVKEIEGKNWFDNFVPAKIRADLKKKHIQGLNNPDKYEKLFPEGYKNAVLTKDGQTKEIRWHNSILKDEEGKLVGSLSSGEDVTLSEAAMEEIEKRNTQLKRLNKVMIGREMRIIDLKKEIKKLKDNN